MLFGASNKRRALASGTGGVGMAAPSGTALAGDAIAVRVSSQRAVCADDERRL